MNFSSHLEDDNPGVGDVVEVDGSFVGVFVPGVTPGVVPVPVDAEPRHTDGAVGQRLGAQAQRLAVQGVVFIEAARPSSLAAGRDVGAGHDAVVDRQRADEGSLVILVRHVVRPGQADTCRPGSGGKKLKFICVAPFLKNTMIDTCSIETRKQGAFYQNDNV